MTIKDHHGLAMTGASPLAADHFRAAQHAYHCMAGDPLPLLQQAAEDSPGFVMGHALTAYFGLVGANAEARAMAVSAYEAARGLPCNDREAGHLAAVGHMVAGEYRAAGRILEDVSIEHPRDALALQAGQLIDYLVGDSRMLRDRIARALPAWSEGMPDYHAVLGLLAFGLEESGQYARAEAAGRKAVALEPTNGWAQHAVAHVLEMQGRPAAGVAWMRADTEAWSRNSFFQVHNWWHLALFHLALGETGEVLSLYDGPIYGAASDMAFDMVDAASLLWRLRLKGVDVGDRWDVVADRFEAKAYGDYAFEDMHAMMAFVGAGRRDAARALIEAQKAAIAGPGDNSMFTAEVGLPVVRGLWAFGEGRYGEAVELLREVRNRSARFGGSHAQRDAIDLTLIAAARLAGQRSLERALVTERAFALPQPATLERLAA